jgi:coenzyme PQQ precursor peptide PqqA
VSAGAVRAGRSSAGGGLTPARDFQNAADTEELHMKWETPVAIDLRFGMEITMYVANR